jgi:hypothetical protein
MIREMKSPGASVADATGAESKADEASLAEYRSPSLNAIAPRRARREPQTPQERWRARNPLKHWAHTATRAAIRLGLIQRQPCAECGAEDAEAHHPDHRDPLRVEWLCRRDHKARHRGGDGSTQ